MARIFVEYFYWHFAVAPFEILRIMENYMNAYWHRFLVIQHLKTLFAPWHRQNPSDLGTKKKTSADKIIDRVIDLYIRLVAAGIRLLIIIVGLLWQIILLALFILLFTIWVSWPIVGVYLISIGLVIIT
ncbi:MAG: hypothetical protein A3J46_01690 [Candidatus Yanofskybacteria bacterium RIFCSPHIGHO2_02_FULL_41_11]|uniref:Uncharacterized protein n=1 Tax=Candidatus Yanofskybacteria bacterium RIFCSPHIGHO2_02_FULL_41_11 TaxID=1802675 RepID=A0A1F8F6B4_9BACT|nr:MAG: hypothetical protein A3J46_01690 [Candidatus Yanofskybacteria bacterium RIFCSPHIGHO2_02_FULL_41_11]